MERSYSRERRLETAPHRFESGEFGRLDRGLRIERASLPALYLTETDRGIKPVLSFQLVYDESKDKFYFVRYTEGVQEMIAKGLIEGTATYSPLLLTATKDLYVALRNVLKGDWLSTLPIVKGDWLSTLPITKGDWLSALPKELMSSGLVHAQVTVTTAEVNLLSANGDYFAVHIFNNGTSTIYIGDTGLSASNGYPLLSGESIHLRRNIGNVFALTLAGTADVRIIAEAYTY
jgi:hypothetical protein